MEVKTVWPFPDKLVRKALAGAKRIVVAEMNLGMIQREVERVIRQPEIKIELFSKIGGIYPQPAGVSAVSGGEAMNPIGEKYLRKEFLPFIFSAPAAATG